HDDEALYFYRAYLRSQPENPTRAEVEQRIKTIEQNIAAKGSAPKAPVERPPSAPPAPQVQVSAPLQPTPVYKKWWLWTVVGVVPVGVAVGVGVGVGTESSPRSLPTVNF